MYEHHHYHMCPTCQKIWHHGPECMGNDQAHTCPACGDFSWGCFQKLDRPTYEQVASAVLHTGGVS